MEINSIFTTVGNVDIIISSVQLEYYSSKLIKKQRKMAAALAIHGAGSASAFGRSPQTGKTEKSPQGPRSWLCNLMGAWF